MKRKTHERVAVELARLLHLDERLVLMGARLPDLDRYVGRHRKTLHSPFVLAGTTCHPALFIGYASHLVLDLIPCKVENGLSAIRRVLNGMGGS